MNKIKIMMEGQRVGEEKDSKSGVAFVYNKDDIYDFTENLKEALVALCRHELTKLHLLDGDKWTEEQSAYLLEELNKLPPPRLEKHN